MTLCIKLHAFPMHLQSSSAYLMHCILDSACYTTLHHPLHPHLCMCHLRLFVCLFTFVTGVGGIIIHHMNHLWSPVPGPGGAIITVLNLIFIPLCKTRK